MCDTSIFQKGADYGFTWTPDWAVRIFFENDFSTDTIFQLEYTNPKGETVSLEGGVNNVIGSMVGLISACVALALF